MTTWGSTENDTKIGINSSWSISGSTATLKQELRFKAGTPMTDGTNTLYWSGHTSGSQTPGIDVSSYTGEKVMKTLTKSYSIPTGTNLSKALSISLYPIEWVGDDRLDASETVSLYGFPNAPTSVSATYVSDSQINIAWTNNSVSGAPVQNVRVQRNDNVDATWITVATLGVTTSYADKSVVANRKYRYRIQGKNSTGYSASAYSGYVYTTPTAPSNLAASKSGTTISLTWTNNAGNATAVEVWHGTKSGGVITWDASALATLGATATSHIHSSVNPALVHEYRVRAVANTVPSAYSNVVEVQLQAAPLAPVVTLSHNVIDFDLTDLVISYAHSPVDSSDQTAAQVRYREKNTVTWTTVTKTTETSHTLLAGSLVNPKRYEVQVATKGDHPNYGPWSASVEVQGSTTPNVVITPTGTYTQSTLVVNLAYFDAESTAMVKAIVKLIQDGVVLETKTTTSTSVTFDTKLANESTYNIEAQVQDGSGLWSVVEVESITTLFLNPPKPTVTAVFDPDLGLVNVHVEVPAPLVTEVAADYVQVYRASGSDWLLIADEAATYGAVTDYLPLLGSSSTYRAVAVSATPSTMASDNVTVLTNTPWVFINGGPGFATSARLKAGASVDATLGRSKVLHVFEGDEDATEFLGVERSRKYKVSGNVGGFNRTLEYGDFKDFEIVADLPAPLCFRDPMGRRIFGSIGDVEVRHSADSGFAKVSFTLTKVGYSE